MVLKNKKAISSIIGSALLIVLAVILIVIVLSWGQGFFRTSINTSNNLLNAPSSDAQYYLTLEDGLNGRFLAKYTPPSIYKKPTLRITRYRLLDYNNIIDFETPIDINANGTQALDMGIINPEFDVVLYLDDDTIITKLGIKNSNRSPRASACPTGYVPVPGNFLYNTVNGIAGGFCVAKYEMKVDETRDGIGDVNDSCRNSGYLHWDNAASTCGYNVGTRHLVTSATGYPLADISQADSITACSSLGSNYHLLTNDEWMTLARNIEQVTSNWSEEIVGGEYIYSGHNDNSPATALSASTDDDGYYTTGQTSGNQRRTLTLTNREVVWDLAGNVWEWTSDTIERKDEPDGFNNSDDSEYTGGWNGEDYYKDGGVSYYLNCSNLGNTTMKYNDLFLLTSCSYQANTNGLGRIYTYSNSADTDTTTYAFLRGGYWPSGAGVGILAMNLGNTPAGGASAARGFRCVYIP